MESILQQIKAAIELVEGAIIQGAIIQSDHGMVYGAKSNDNTIFFHTMRKVNETQFNTVYEGIIVRTAAIRYVEVAGPIEAIGSAVKWFREKNERNRIITVQADNA